ncbi:MAG TPA: carbohydrate ABC transporter permease [Actinomycetota bacterium]|nr:carbohydrate ABC transporter permease [Actinomycetota bacterium]
MSSAEAAPRAAARAGGGRTVRRVLGYGALGLLAAVSLLPFLWMLSTSLKSLDEVFVYPPRWIPREFRFDNYVTLWTDFPLFNTWILNSFKIVIVIVGAQVFICSLSAYAFARLEFPGRDLLFYLYVGSMLVPDVVNILPNYVIARQLGWIDTHTALIVPSMASAFGIFMLRQFFLTIPRELEDAARVDGASYWRIYRDIVLPLSGPAIATLTVFLFIWNWNDFLSPLIMLNTPPKYTIQLGLAFVNDARSTDWNRLMSGNLISLTPLLVVYALAQRHLVQGITLTGLKG